jgi:hypothetical protein
MLCVLVFWCIYIYIKTSKTQNAFRNKTKNIFWYEVQASSISTRPSFMISLPHNTTSQHRIITEIEYNNNTSAAHVKGSGQDWLLPYLSLIFQSCQLSCVFVTRLQPVFAGVMVTAVPIASEEPVRVPVMTLAIDSIELKDLKDTGTLCSC